jgi:hypothetical protein
MRKYNKLTPSKQDLQNKLEILNGITLQMYRILDSLEKSGNIDSQLKPLLHMAFNDYMKYISEEL